MKFLTFYEFNVEDMDTVIEKYKQLLAESEKKPKKFPKILFGPFMMGECAELGVVKNVTIHEVDDPKQLMTLLIYFSPEISYKFVPLFEASMGIPLWEEMKK